MVYIDMTRPANGDTPEPGIHAVRIARAEARTSKAGNQMISVELVDVKTGWHVLYDNYVLSGRGWMHAKRRLSVLGIREDFSNNFDPTDLIGLTAFVATVASEYQGKPRLEVDFAQGRSGYFRPDEPPSGHKPIEPVQEEEFGAAEAPF